MSGIKRKYVPDLVKQSVICETNYARLVRMLPAGESAVEYRIEWHQHPYVVSIRREEEFSYTSTWIVSYWPENSSPWFNPQSIVVRLYHDARMAEVVCMKRKQQLSGRYEYPNEQMRHPDEKYQLNHHLAEWLSYCVSHGAVPSVRVARG